jgi:hypothetical protein
LNSTVFISDNAAVEITFEFEGATSAERTKRVNGFSVKNNPTPDPLGDKPNGLDPSEVTVSWTKKSNAKESRTFALDFGDKEWTELYFDLPELDIEEVKFDFTPDSAAYDWMSISTIRLFGPSQADVDNAK